MYSGYQVLWLRPSAASAFFPALQQALAKSLQTSQLRGNDLYSWLVDGEISCTNVTKQCFLQEEQPEMSLKGAHPSSIVPTAPRPSSTYQNYHVFQTYWSCLLPQELPVLDWKIEVRPLRSCRSCLRKNGLTWRFMNSEGQVFSLQLGHCFQQRAHAKACKELSSSWSPRCKWPFWVANQ